MLMHFIISYEKRKGKSVGVESVSGRHPARHHKAVPRHPYTGSRKKSATFFVGDFQRGTLFSRIISQL